MANLYGLYLSGYMKGIGGELDGSIHGSGEREALAFAIGVRCGVMREEPLPLRSVVDKVDRGFPEEPKHSPLTGQTDPLTGQADPDSRGPRPDELLSVRTVPLATDPGGTTSRLEALAAEWRALDAEARRLSRAAADARHAVQKAASAAEEKEAEFRDEAGRIQRGA